MPNMDVGILLLIVISAFVALFLTLYFLLRRRKRNTSDTAAGVSLSHLFAPALLGIFVCLFSLCGLTYAWYSTSAGSTVQTIQAAVFRTDAVCTEEGGAELQPDSERNGVLEFSLSKGKTYQFHLSPAADSTASRGYCRISITAADTTVYTTETLGPGSEYVFTVEAGQAATLQIAPIWGEGPTDAFLNNSKIQIPALDSPDASANSPAEPSADVSEGPSDAPEKPSLEPTEPSAPEDSAEESENSAEEPEPSAADAPVEEPSSETEEPTEAPSEEKND